MEERVLYYLMPIFKLLLFFGLVIGCFFPVLIFFNFDFITFDEKSIYTQIGYEAGVGLAVVGALLMVFKILKTYDFESLFIIKKNVLSGFLKGTLIGSLLLSCCIGVAFLNGNVSFTLGSINIVLFILFLVYYIVVACFEELLFRSFPLVVLAERYPVALSITITSILFGLAHLGNAGFTWLAMLNITLAGALFSIFVLQKRNISWAIGLHFGWNFTQGTLLGFQVSGENSPGLLVAKPTGTIYFSGGSFGIEGSVFCTVFMMAIIGYLLYKHPIEPVYEHLVDFNEEENTAS